MSSRFRPWRRPRTGSEISRAAANRAARQRDRHAYGPQLTALRLVLVLTIVAAGVIGVLAVRDLRGLAAESSGVSTPVDDTADRSGLTKQQVAIRVTIEADGPFTASVTDIAKKQKTFESSGEDVVWTRVYEGAGPYVFVTGQIGATGTIGCRIEVDGRTIDEDEVDGTFVQTFCQG